MFALNLDTAIHLMQMNTPADHRSEMNRGSGAGKGNVVGSDLTDRKLAHHTAILVLENMAMIHVGKLFSRQVIETHNHF